MECRYTSTQSGPGPLGGYARRSWHGWVLSAWGTQTVTQAEIYLSYLFIMHVGPVAVAVGNFNGDGKPHLVVSGVLVSLRTLIINSH